MVIGVDAGCLGIKDERLKAGVYQVALNLFKELGKIDKKNIYLLYSFYPIDKILLKSFGSNFKNIVVKPSRGWMKIWLPLQLLKDKPNVFLGLNNTLPLNLPMQKYRSIVMIHDLLFEEYPELYPGSYRKLHKESRLAVRKADKIIVPSNATRMDVEKYYKITKEKIVVAYEGVRSFPNFKSQDTIHKTQNSDYFLFVGALKPQKNVPILLNAFSKIKIKELRAKNLNLIIVGGDKWIDRGIDSAIKTLPEKIKERIQFLGIVDDSTLTNLYKNALAFVSPSLSEGFGLTFLEAMSFGTPVIGPNRGSVTEVVGDAGILVDPENTSEITKAMEKMMNEKVRNEFKRKARKQARKFVWVKFARAFLDSIQSLGYNSR